MKFRMLSNTVGWTRSFPIFTWCKVPFEKCMLRFGPKIFVLFREIDLDFGGTPSWNTQPNCFEFFNKASEPLSPLFFGFFVGLTVSLFVPQYALFAECASRF